LDKFIRSEATSGVVGGSDDAVVVAHQHKVVGTLLPVGTEPSTRFLLNALSPEYSEYVVSEGVSGVGKNIPSKISAIPIIRMS